VRRGLSGDPALPFRATSPAVRAAALPCPVCGHPVVAPKNHDIPAPRAARTFPLIICKCGKPARVRCFNGAGALSIECADGHGRAKPA
jgi:hypothetical protein